MTGDDATPTPHDPEGQHHLGKTLTGWEEIRRALEFERVRSLLLKLL
ncbi:MAG: hypothetical protein ACFFEE_04195 [Candidatus Thorarchaeota archaeon]